MKTDFFCVRCKFICFVRSGGWSIRRYSSYLSKPLSRKVIAYGKRLIAHGKGIDIAGHRVKSMEKFYLEWQVDLERGGHVCHFT